MNDTSPLEKRRLLGLMSATLKAASNSLRQQFPRPSVELNADEATVLLRELTDEPLFRDESRAGGWVAAVRLRVQYEDGRTVVYDADWRFMLWACDDDRGGIELGDRLATPKLKRQVLATLRAKQ